MKLLVKTQNTKRYETNTLRSMGPQIWNNLSTEQKNAKNLNIFKELIKIGQGFSVAAMLAQMDKFFRFSFYQYS